MDLESLTIFARVAEFASFTQAAERLGLTKARVSTAVRTLEAQLGTRLLHRTTRRVRMTPDGEAFYARCTAVLADLDELGALFQQAPAALRGRLRVDLPTGLAHEVVIPRLSEFIAAHPQLSIELSTSDRRVDLVGEGFDCVLRVGELGDSELVGRRIGEFGMINCASPAYLAAHGTPQTLEDLDRHRLIHYSTTLDPSTAAWEYHDGTRWCLKPMRASVTVNNAQAYQAACLAGLGLIQVPASGKSPLFASGALVPVLPTFSAKPMPVSLLYAHRGGLSKRLQAWMDWLAGVVGEQFG